MYRMRLIALVVGALIAFMALPSVTFADPIGPDVNPNGLTFDAAPAGATLTVAGPDGYEFSATFGPGEAAAFSAAGLADGQYKYQFIQNAGQNLRGAAAGEGRGGDGSANLSGPSAESISGVFTVSGGTILDPSLMEPGVANLPESPDAPADIIHTDDVIINGGSLCVGFDCSNGVSFGFDTVRLKENNLRIHFEDTSNSASFPTNDWRIRINDSTNGGDSYFAIEDSTAGNTPFRVDASAGANAIYVDAQGDVGLNTSNPVLELQITDGDSPGIRFEQNGSNGWQPQTYDIATNETNFFIRDATNGSKLPFRLRPGAPTSSIDVAASGNVGLGDSSPDASLDVERSNGTAQIRVDENSSTVTNRTLLHLENTGNPRLLLQNSDTSREWLVETGTNGDDFRLQSTAAPGGNENFVLDFDGNLDIGGNLIVAGTATCGGGACRSARAASAAEMLSKLASVPFVNSEARYVSLNASGESVTSIAQHLKPDSSAFFAAYGLGKDENSIAPLDVASVALAAAQALQEQAQLHNSQLSSLQAEVDALQAQNASLEARLAALEAALGVESPAAPDVSANQLYLPSAQN